MSITPEFSHYEGPGEAGKSIYAVGEHLRLDDPQRKYGNILFNVKEVLSLKGVMAEVYKIQEMMKMSDGDIAEKRLLVAKVLKYSGKDNPDFLLRFRREVEAIIAREKSGGGTFPYVVPIYDMVTLEQDRIALLFPFFSGGDLAQNLKEKVRREGACYNAVTVSNIGKRIALALNGLHEEGYIHRDVKPDNFICKNKSSVEDCYLSDFGIARPIIGQHSNKTTMPINLGSQGESTEITREGAIMGTLEYLSPEQILGEVLDGRSDLFALGVSLYQLRTGKYPTNYDKDNLISLYANRGRGVVVDISTYLGIDNITMVDEIIMQLLKRDREERSHIILSDGTEFSLKTGLDAARAFEYAGKNIP